MHHFHFLIKVKIGPYHKKITGPSLLALSSPVAKKWHGFCLVGFLPLNSSTVCLEEKAELMKGVVDFTASSTGFMSKMSRWGGEPTQPFEDEKGPFRCRSEGKNTEYKQWKRKTDWNDWIWEPLDKVKP